MSKVQLFLSPSGHFEVIENDVSSIEELRLVKLLRDGNPVLVDVSSFEVIECQEG